MVSEYENTYSDAKHEGLRPRSRASTAAAQILR